MPWWLVLLVVTIALTLWAISQPGTTEETSEDLPPVERCWWDSRWSVRERLENDLPLPVWKSGELVWLMPEDPEYAMLKEVLLSRRKM